MSMKEIKDIAKELPRDWTISQLNNLITTRNGLWKGKKPPFRKARVIRNTNFNNDGTLDLSDVAELKVQDNQFSSRRLQQGDIILERSGGGPSQPVGRVVLFDLDDDDFSFSNFTTRLRLESNNLLIPSFLLYYLLHFYNEGYTNALQSRTTGIRNLSFTDYKNIPIPIPSLDEQRAIAHVLSTVRQAIEATEEVITAARELKRSMMKHLFTYGPVPVDQADQVPLKETEIGEIPLRWNLVSIDNIANVKGGKRLPKGHTYSQEPTDYPYLRVTDFSNYAIDETNLKYLTIEDWQQLKRYTISSDDVYISIAGTTGIVGIVPKRLDKSHLTENAAKIILDNKNEIQKEYLVYYLSSTLGQHQIGIRTTKTSQPKLALTRIKQIPLPQPSIETQRTISRYLSSIDNKISIEINTKKSLESLFNSLLHHLMTGKVRVPYEQRI